MAFLGDLLVRLKAETADFEQNLSRAASTSQRAFRSMQNAASAATGTLGMVGVALNVGGMVAFTKSTIDAADGMNDLAKSTAISVENLSGLQLLAKQTSSELEGTATSIRKLSQNMGKDPMKFESLGISAKEPLEAFKQFADIFVGIKDDQERAAVSAAVLGKAWASAAPALMEGSKGIQSIIDKGKVISGMTKDMAENADKFNDEMAEFGLRVRGAGNDLTTVLLPGLIDIGKAMNQAAQESGILWGIFIGLSGAIAELSRTKVTITGLEESLAYAQRQLDTGKLRPDNPWWLPNTELTGEMLAIVKRRIQTDTKTLQDMTKSIKPPKNTEADVWDEILVPTKTEMGARKFLNWEKEQAATEAAKKKASAEAIAREKLFRSTLQGLEKEYRALNSAGAESAIIYEMQDGALKKLLPSEKEALRIQAQKNDAFKIQLELDKSVADSTAAKIKVDEDAGAAVTAMHRAMFATNDDLSFSLTLIGKTIDQQEEMNALRKIDLDLRERLASLPFSDDNPAAGARAVESLNAMAAEQRKIVLDDFRVRRAAERSWVAGAAQAFDEYIRNASNAAAQTNLLFSNAFKGLEDMLVDFVMTGKLNFKDFALSVVRDLVRIQIQTEILKPILESLRKTMEGKKAAESSGGGTGSIFGMLASVAGAFFGGDSTMTAEANVDPAAWAVEDQAALGGSYATGTNFVPRDMTAKIHRGEAIIPAAQNIGGGSGGGTYYIDARGADAEKIAQLEQMIYQLHGSVERRAVAAVSESRRRGGTFSRSFG